MVAMKLKKKPRKSSIELDLDEFIIGVPDDVGTTSTRSKAGKKAKRKGGAFERKIAKSLSNFWGATFHRTPASGGSPLKGDYNMAGDLCTSDADWKFHVECKNQEALAKLHTIFTSRKSAVWKWWKQTTEECPADQVPLLVFTKNRIPEFCMIPEYFWESVEWGRPSSLESNSYIRVGDVVVITLNRFLEMGKERCLKALNLALQKKAKKLDM